MVTLQREKSENESVKRSDKPQRLPNGKVLIELDHPPVRASVEESAARRARLIAEGRLIEQPANARLASKSEDETMSSEPTAAVAGEEDRR
jgi:hypothetical protein